MNEEQKNIETCLAEDILSEVASVPTDPQFVSLTDEALDPLKQQALQQAGYDGYKEVVMYHQPYTFSSSVKQMKSNLILLLRRLWRFPFGRGTTASSAAGTTAASAAGSAGSAAGSSAASAAAPIRSLADMWQHYITRLKGNPEYGIPSRLSSLTDLPSAPALLADRTIGGAIGAPDGMSLAQLLGSKSAMAAITKIQDTSDDWILDMKLPYFPNADLLMNCKTIKVGREIDMPIVRAGGNLELPEVTGLVKEGFNTQYGGCILCTDGDKIIAPKLKRIDPFGSSWTGFAPFGFDGKLHKFVVGTLTSVIFYNNKKRWFGKSTGGDTYGDTTELMHWELGQDTAISLDLSTWSATMCLRTDTTDSEYVDLREDTTLTNNLQQFLQNFKTYIAERLTDNGTGLTLTLSQEVRNAIHAAEAEYGIENIIITQKGWTISPAPN